MKHCTTLLIITCLLLSCNHGNKDLYSNNVKLSTQINNLAETIHIGDTLKFKLIIPDTIVTSQNDKVVINSMQRSYYAFHLNRIDTTNNAYTSVWDNAVVTDGGYLERGGAVYLSTNTKPFRATLNIIPSVKGLYNLQVTTQPGFLRVNNNYTCGLIVNFDVANKHWHLFDPYYPGSSTSAANSDAAGYGCYYFRVN